MSTGAPTTTTDSCCDAAEQATCCEPAQKSGCCGSATGGCGCR